MRYRIAAALASAVLVAAPLPAQQAPPSVALPFEEFTLANGLRVLVHEDRSTPVVSVNVWYHVGSANERAGRTGFAHLFEHLMFEGSLHVPEGKFDEWLEAAGAVNNGSTNVDRTNYYEDGPTSALELMLYLEADRMGWLPAAMTEAKLDAQREVVKNERRQSYENRPYGLAWERLSAMLYPERHPYRHPTIGSMADLDAATLHDVLDFFRTYYAPNNATLAVAGDIDTRRVRALVETYFAEIPRGPAVAPVAAPPARLAAPSYAVLEDEVQLPRLYKAWHSPAYFAPGDAELDVLANLLAGGLASRLHRKLVYEREVAQDVSAFQSSARHGSEFVVVATARPGVSLDLLEQAIDDEVRAVAEYGIEPRELERAVNQVETSFVDALENVGGFGGKANRLNLYAFYTGDPGYAEEDLARYRALTPAAVQAAARRWLADAPAATLSVVPVGETGLAASQGGR